MSGRVGRWGSLNAWWWLNLFDGWTVCDGLLELFLDDHPQIIESGAHGDL